MTSIRIILRTLRILLRLGVTLVLLVAIALASLLISLDDTSLQSYVEQAVSYWLDRPVTIEGSLAIHHGVEPSLEISDLTIANPPWASRPDFARIQSLRVSISLPALVLGRIDLAGLEIQGVNALFETSAHGEPNWSCAGPRQTDGFTGSPPLIRARSVEHSKLGYRSATAQYPWLALERLTGRLDPNARLQLSGELGYRDQPLTLRMSGKPAGNDAYSVHSEVRGLNTTLQVAGSVTADHLFPIPLDVHLNGQSVADLEPLLQSRLPKIGPYTFSGTLAPAPDGFSIRKIHGGIDGLPQVDRLEIESAEIRSAKRLQITVDGKLAGIKLKGSLLTRTPDELLAAASPLPIDLRGQWGGARLQLKGQASITPDNPELSAEVDISGNPEAIVTHLMPMPWPDDLDPLSVSARVTATRTRLSATRLRAQIGASDVSGNLSWNSEHPQPVLKGRLKSRKLVLDELLDRHEDSSQQGSAPFTQRLKDFVVPNWVSRFDADIGLSVSHWSSATWQGKDIQARLLLRQGRLTLRAHHLEDDGRSLSESIVLDANQSPPQVTVNIDSDRVDIARTLAILGLNSRFSGSLGETGFRLSGRGTTLGQLLGDAEITLTAKRGSIAFPHPADGSPDTVSLRELSIAVARGRSARVHATGRYSEQPFTVSFNTGPLRLLFTNTGPWKVSMDGHSGTTAVSVSGSIEKPLSFDGAHLAVSLQGRSTRVLNAFLGLDLPPARRFHLSSKVFSKGALIGFRGVDAGIDDSDLSGTIIWNANKEKPLIAADLRSAKLDISDLLDLESRERRRTARESQRDDRFDFALLNRFDAELDIRLARLVNEDAPLGSVKLVSSLNNGHLVTSLFQGTLAGGGSFASSLDLHTTLRRPYATFRFSGTRINYGHLVDTLFLRDKAEGSANIQLTLQSEADSVSELVDGLSGQLTLSGGSGRINDESLMLDVTISSLMKLMAPRFFNRDRAIDINCMAGIVNFGSGVASTDQLLLDTKEVTLAGSGTVDLGTRQLDLILAPHPKSLLFSLSSPIKITGSLLDPRYSVTSLPKFHILGFLHIDLANPARLIPSYLSFLTDHSSKDAPYADHNRCLKAILDQEGEATRAQDLGPLGRVRRGFEDPIDPHTHK